MTIYLYKKTHNKTGLQYLGKTTSSNPHKYRGSGTYWCDHIKIHGYDVTTEIIKECQSKEELKQCGKYYSELWNVVNARDENGKKVWANLKPEEGDGGFSFDINPMKDPAVKEKIAGNNHYSKQPGYTWKLTGNNNSMTRPEVVAKISGDNNYQRKTGYVPKRYGETHHNYNSIIYHWINEITGEELDATVNAMRKLTGAGGNVSKVAMGKRRVVCGWTCPSAYLKTTE